MGGRVVVVSRRRLPSGSGCVGLGVARAPKKAPRTRSAGKAEANFSLTAGIPIAKIENPDSCERFDRKYSQRTAWQRDWERVERTTEFRGRGGESRGVQRGRKALSARRGRCIYTSGHLAESGHIFQSLPSWQPSNFRPPGPCMSHASAPNAGSPVMRG